MVSLPPRRNYQIRREPTQEIRRHCQCGFRQPGPRRVVGRVARHDTVLDRRGRAHLSRRQPAHQALAVLGVADPRGKSALPGGDLPVRGVYPAENDAGLGQGRVHPVLYLLYLAQHQVGANRVFDRADVVPDKGILSTELLHEYTRYFAGIPAGGWPAGVPYPSGAGGDAVARLWYLQRVGALRKSANSRARRISPFGEVRVQGVGLGSRGKHQRGYSSPQPLSTKQCGYAGIWEPSVSELRRSEYFGLCENLGARGQCRHRPRQSRSAWSARG